MKHDCEVIEEKKLGKEVMWTSRESRWMLFALIVLTVDPLMMRRAREKSVQSTARQQFTLFMVTFSISLQVRWTDS